jgi:hypothetical protein
VSIWSVPGPTKRQKSIVVTGLGDDGVSIGGATLDKEPHADGPRHKEQGWSPLMLLRLMRRSSSRTWRPLSVRTVDDGPDVFNEMSVHEAFVR